MTTFRRRDVGPAVVRALGSLPVVVLTGMRQTGKTTFLEHQPELRGRRIVTFDDFAQLEAARDNPETLLAGDEPLTIDEAQKCPELLTAIKREVDRQRRPGRFLLSGSANFALLKDVSETLAGRALYLTMHPFSRRELRGSVEAPPLLRSFLEAKPRLPAGGAPVSADEVLTGGMPSVCLGEALGRDLWFQGFEQTYLERDVRSLAQVADLVAFRRLMKLAALRTAQVLNQTELGRDAQLNAVTTGRYLALMETSYVLHRLPPYLSNRTSRVIKAPKLFFTDAGLAGYLTGVHDVAPASDEPMRGALFETYVAQNLASILSAHWPQARLHYWYVHGRHEVDFVVEAGRDCLAIEVKAATRWEKRDLAGLQAFLANVPRCRAAILAYNGREVVRLQDRLWAVPIGLMVS
ncbi:MAG: ATP-binding protein [Planctomycetes bacterium]|nr:ATP-binding protein [Planctomycetota bacterium]